MVKVSGTDTRPGALVVAPAAGEPPAAFAASALAWLVLFAWLTALPAFCASLPGKPLAGAEPGAAGLLPPPGGVLVLAAPADGYAPLAGVPGLKSSISMPVPRAARSSCTSRLGMSSVVGTALPRRRTV